MKARGLFFPSYSIIYVRVCVCVGGGHIHLFYHNPVILLKLFQFWPLGWPLVCFTSHNPIGFFTSSLSGTTCQANLIFSLCEVTGNIYILVSVWFLAHSSQNSWDFLNDVSSMSIFCSNLSLTLAPNTKLLNPLEHQG